MQQLVFLIFPEFKTLIAPMAGKMVRFILKKYTTPERIGSVDKKVLGEEIRKKSWGKLGIKEAELLIKAAQQTVGIKEGVAGIVVDITYIIAQLEVVERFISEVEAEMVMAREQVPCSARFLSIKGLGVVSVAGLIGEVGDFSKFRTQSEIIKLAGLDLYEVSSGKREGQRRITKRGRSLMRKILYFAVVLMVKRNGIMHEYYERLTGRGTLRMRALVATMRKLLRIIHAMMRDNRDYVGQHEAPKRRVIKKAA